MVCPDGLPVHTAGESGCSGAGQQIAVNLIREACAVCLAVVVGDGELIFLVVGYAIVVLVVCPHGDIGDSFGHGVVNRGLPTDENMVCPDGLSVHTAGESGSSGAGQQIAVNLICEACAVCLAVVVGDGVLFSLAYHRVGDRRGTTLHTPCAVFVFEGDRLAALIFRRECVLCRRIRVVTRDIGCRIIHSNGAGIPAGGIALHAADGIGPGNQSVDFVGMGNLAVDAVDFYRIA